MNPQDKRDLPEVVAEILIEQHAMRQDIGEMRQDINGLRREIKEEIGGLRQEMRTSQENLVLLFNNMTNAILDAMNRGNDRYDRTGQELDQLKVRATKLKNPAA
ncbi:hypothetical protein [Hymenobacter sp. PAMC 26628]|uniref:hypothetical protein n=1 Tax=Hymenobacter sp. PAMC 26628 TaxID=1484118 RepID=UPI0007700CD0|nr:hypothetical protein [Hymenobacter sp. PAMC 26628]AMJ64659.1 hypothetical protein AXW84_03870 [Hymenobacter sp. PAMC 26628]